MYWNECVVHGPLLQMFNHMCSTPVCLWYVICEFRRWSLIESVFKICTKKDVDFDRVHRIIETATVLVKACKNAMATCGWAVRLVERLKITSSASTSSASGIASDNNDDDDTLLLTATCFTETSGILSLSMALSALLLDDARPLFADSDKVRLFVSSILKTLYDDDAMLRSLSSCVCVCMCVCTCVCHRNF